MLILFFEFIVASMVFLGWYKTKRYDAILITLISHVQGSSNIYTKGDAMTRNYKNAIQIFSVILLIRKLVKNTYIQIYIHTYIHTYVYIYICICLYVYMHVYTYTFILHNFILFCRYLPFLNKITPALFFYKMSRREGEIGSSVISYYNVIVCNQVHFFDFQKHLIST